MNRGLLVLISVVAALCVVAQPGYGGALVAHWPLDGNALDTSGNNYNGTANGNVAYVAGMYGQAAQFDGNGDYLQMPNNPGTQLLAANEFTAAVYVKTPSTGHQNILIHGLGCSTWASWFLGVEGGEPDATRSPGNFVFGVRTSSTGSYTGVQAQAVANEWVHIAVTHDGTTMRLYLNGEEWNSAAAPLPYNSGESLYIGGDPGCNGRSWYTGLVDDVFIFSKSATPDQVRQLASGTVPSWLKAEKPNPADGALGVGMPLLQWSKGETGVLHNVYLGTSPDLTDADLKAARIPMTLYYHVQGLTPGTTYYWRVDEVEKDGVTVHPGDVWSFMTQALTAYHPDPADGANTVLLTGTLTWMAGVGTIKHHVYFGNNLDAVSQAKAEADKGTLAAADATFAPGTLESLTSYYWRVDEVVGGDAVKAGPVWSFTTVLPIDDFDSYTDDDGSRIYQTWVDGWTNNSGSIVGYAQAPFAEQTIVHGGKQSMPLDYNNIKAPFYSEAEREFATAQDWTAKGTGGLVLYVRGRPGNAATPLYVAVEDASKRVGVVTHPDPAVATLARWTEWKIPFSEFTAAGVNLARVKKLYVGLGDRANPKAGRTGRVFVDDIGLTKP